MVTSVVVRLFNAVIPRFVVADYLGSFAGRDGILRQDFGHRYVLLKLDDPSFPAPIFVNLMADDCAQGAYNLIWSRRD
jgi:uncharacterized protein (DUF736 family)